MLHPLSIMADLALSVDGEDVQVVADGDVIRIKLADARAARKLLWAAPLGHFQAQGLGQIHDLLSASGLTAEVQLYGEPVARLGKNARPGGTSRLLRLGDMEVRPGRPIRAAARRRPGTTLALAAGLGLLGTVLYATLRRD
ncbi:MAG: hypothetical protein ACR2GR_02160 [Rhodothermales bacterium]